MGIFDSIGNMFSSAFNPQRGYEAAGKEIGKSWNEAKGYLMPYNQAGLDQIPKLVGAENELLDPSKLLEKWMGGYEKSPYATQLQKEAQAQGAEAAAGQGLLGSSAALSNIQNSSTNIMNADRRNYLNDLMQKYLSGIGIGQNLFGTGAQMGANLGQGALHTGENLAQTEFGRLNAPGEMLLKMLGLAGGIYSGNTGGSGGGGGAPVAAMLAGGG